MFIHSFTRSDVNQEEKFETFDQALWNSFLCSTLDGFSIGEIYDESRPFEKTGFYDLKGYWLEKGWQEGLTTKLAAFKKFGV